MRIQNSLKNFGSGLGMNLVSSILAFISRTIFINVLGTAYLGVNGLLTNVLSMLSLAELGVGTAINFSLYKPVAEGDNKKILLLMKFYKNTYRWIGMLVFGIGLILMMFLDVIIKNPGDVKNLKLIFFIYLINTSYSYLMSYKNTLLSANQKDYLLAPVNIIFNVITVMIQIGVLLIAKNYIMYLLTNMVMLFIQRLYINNKITKMYPILREETTDKLKREDLKLIIKNVKAMMFHKIGDYCINGTDNIIISAFISVSMVGLYSNYLMIITMVNGIIVMFFNSMTASMGNLIATECDEKKIEIFEVINFMGFWLFGFATICFYNLLNPFIELWLGKEFLISSSVLTIVLLNYYLTGMRVPVATLKSAAGIYDEDKYTPLIQAAVNLLISIVLVHRWGLAGVFMGTLVSSIILPCWQRPYIVCKYALKISSKGYFKRYIQYLITVILVNLSISKIFNLFWEQSILISFIIRMFICIVIPNIVFILLFNKTKEFRKILNIADNFLGGRLNWIKKLV
ncbi:teichoic acid transporter [Clostridium botulinum]|nr:teichoic acid transporter [Clostridium botulinum]